jgi:hypothetical protein
MDLIIASIDAPTVFAPQIPRGKYLGEEMKIEGVPFSVAQSFRFFFTATRIFLAMPVDEQ